MHLLVRHDRSSSQTTNVIAMLLRKTSGLVELVYGFLDDRRQKKRRGNKVAPSIASSLTVQGFGWLMRALKA